MPKLNEIVGEEAYKAIPDGVRNKYKDIDFVDSTGYVEKPELDTANKTIKQYKKDIAKRDTDLTDLQGKIKDNEDLNNEIEKLKKENKKAMRWDEARKQKIRNQLIRKVIPFMKEVIVLRAGLNVFNEKQKDQYVHH